MADNTSNTELSQTRRLSTMVSLAIAAAILLLSPILLSSAGGLQGILSVAAVAAAVALFSAARWITRMVAFALVVLAISWAIQDHRDGILLDARVQRARDIAAHR